MERYELSCWGLWYLFIAVLSVCSLGRYIIHYLFHWKWLWDIHYKMIAHFFNFTQYWVLILLFLPLPMQPREKLAKYGHEKLEWRELVAILLRTGTKWVPVSRLSKKVNKIIEEKGEHIGIIDLENIKWVWPVKAAQIICAFELAKRYFLQDAVCIESTDDVLSEVKERRNKKQEHLICLTLDGANRLISKRVVTIGLLNQSLIHPREVFAGAIEDRANSIILVHNHPSGTVYPSNEDKAVTQRLQKAADLLGIKFIDHIIITKERYWSFKEQGDEAYRT